MSVLNGGIECTKRIEGGDDSLPLSHHGIYVCVLEATIELYRFVIISWATYGGIRDDSQGANPQHMRAAPKNYTLVYTDFGVPFGKCGRFVSAKPAARC